MRMRFARSLTRSLAMIDCDSERARKVRATISGRLPAAAAAIACAEWLTCALAMSHIMQTIPFATSGLRARRKSSEAKRSHAKYMTANMIQVRRRRRRRRRAWAKLCLSGSVAQAFGNQSGAHNGTDLSREPSSMSKQTKQTARRCRSDFVFVSGGQKNGPTDGRTDD